MDIEKIMEELSDSFYSQWNEYLEMIIRLENEIMKKLYRVLKVEKMNTISFAKPFFSLRAMTGRRGSRS